MSVVHIEGFGYRGAATGMALEYTLGGGGTLTETTMTTRRSDCRAASIPDVSITKLIALSGAQVITGFAYQWTSGAADFCQILDADESTIHVTIHVDAAGLLSAWRGDSATGSSLGSAVGGTELVSGVPVYITVSVTVDDVDGVVVVRVGSSTPLNLTTKDTQNGGTASVGAATLYGPAGGALVADWYIMDPLEGSAYIAALGDIRIDCYLPTSSSDWSDLSGAYTDIDETTPNSDTDYISGSSAGQRSTFKFGPMTHEPSSIISTRIIATARCDATPRSLRIGWENDTDYPGTGVIMRDAEALTTSYAVYDAQYSLGLAEMIVATLAIESDQDFSSEGEFNNTGFGVEVG